MWNNISVLRRIIIVVFAISLYWGVLHIPNLIKQKGPTRKMERDNIGANKLKTQQKYYCPHVHCIAMLIFPVPNQGYIDYMYRRWNFL